MDFLGEAVEFILNGTYDGDTAGSAKIMAGSRPLVIL